MNTVPEGIRNNNPGNIDWSAGTTWVGQVHPQPLGQRFCIFLAPVYGIRALLKLLQNYQKEEGLQTIRQFISRWAPPSENDTEKYIKDVLDYMNNGIATVSGANIWEADSEIDVASTDLEWLARAVIHHENGVMPYTNQEFDTAGEMLGMEFV